MSIQKFASLAIACGLLSACGGGSSPANSSTAPVSNPTPAPTAAPVSSATPTASIAPTANPNAWPVAAYKTLKANDATSLSKVASVTSSTPDKGVIVVDGNNLELTGTVASDTLVVNGWVGSWAQKVDFRAIMLCDSSNKSKYVLIEDKSPTATINELKGKTFEYVEDCVKDATAISVAQDGSVSGLVNVSAAAVTQAFSATGYNNGTSTTFLHGYKVLYPDGRYWYFVVEIGKNNADASKGYIGWWKQTAPVN